MVAVADDTLLANATLEFIDALPRVQVEPVPQFPGALFAALPGGRRRPAIIVLGGSEGGSMTARSWARALASHGFAVLGFPYYSPPSSWQADVRELPDLPAAFADIPVDRLNLAYDWLRRRDDVDATRVALVGVAKGAEFALIAASHFRWISAVVAKVPSDVVCEGFGVGVQPGSRSSFSLYGKPLPFVPSQGTAHPDAAVKARIRVENFRGPLLVIGGEDEQNIAERRAAAGLETVTLTFSHVGHAISGHGWTSNAAARARAYPETIAFLRRVLKLREH